MIKWCKSVEYTLKRILKDAPTPAKGLESSPGKKAEMYSRNHPFYPQPQTCIWLRIGKGGAEAMLGRFFNAKEVKCRGDCNEKCNKIYTLISKMDKSFGPTIDKETAAKISKDIEEDFRKWEKGERKGSYTPITKIGEIEAHVIEFLRSQNIKLEEKNILISGDRITHMFRESKKERGAALSIEELEDFIVNMKSYNIVYDHSHNNLIYYKEDEHKVTNLLFNLITK